MTARIVWRDAYDKHLFSTELHHDDAMTPHFRVIRGNTSLKAQPPFDFRCVVLFEVDDEFAEKFPQSKDIGNGSASVACHLLQARAILAGR